MNPDYKARVGMVCFYGKTVSEALRKAADWADQNPFDINDVVLTDYSNDIDMQDDPNPFVISMTSEEICCEEMK